MKRNNILFSVLAILIASATLASASASLPENWEVDLAAQPPQVFTLQRPRGETYELEAVLKNHGKPFEQAITNAFIYWQTNGMENLYWSAPASVSNNVLRATWLPSMDPGSATVRGYIGDPGHIYAAAFQFRFISSPGATPNELPLPQKVIDFAKVTVLNPPWSGGGGGGGVDTNAVRDIIHETVSGSARSLPKYLHERYFDDSYPEAAAEYYRSRGNGKSDGGCSAVRDGGFLYRNFDYPFDDRAEFVVRVSAASERFASVGVAQVGTNLTEQIVTSGKTEYSHLYKWLPGATVDGINEKGVACNINVVSGDPHEVGWPTNGTIHCLGAVRWVLDNATNAASAASVLATEVYFPSGWTQNFHYMVCDERETWIVENGSAHDVTYGVKVLTNFRLYPTRDTTGEGQERYDALAAGDNITSQWWTLTYTPNGYRASDLPGITGESLTQLFNYWENNPRESHRGETFGDQSWWQSVHTSVYDLTNRVLRICVQETPDWYTFTVPAASSPRGVDENAVREIVKPMLSSATNDLSRSLSDSISGKRDYDDLSYNHGIGPGHGTFNVTQDGTSHEELVWGGHLHSGYEWAPSTSQINIDVTIVPVIWPRVSLISAIDSSASHEFNALEGDEFDLTIETPIGTEQTYHIKVDPYVPDSVDNLATESGVAEAIAANEKTGTDDEIVRGRNYGQGGYEITVEFASQALYAKNADFAESDYVGNNIVATYAKKTELDAKRDLTDNTCHQSEFTEWVCTPVLPSNYWFGWYDDGHGDVGWAPFLNRETTPSGRRLGDADSTSLSYGEADWAGGFAFTATRSAVCTDGEKFVTSDVVDGKVSAAVSTNNPAFVSAVRAIAPATIRTYDNIRQCWWVLEMVNGVPTWTVED